MDSDRQSAEPVLHKIATVLGFALLAVASATVFALPSVAAICSLPAAALGLFLRRKALSHVVLLPGGLAIFTLSIFATATATDFLIVHLTPLGESLFFNFGMFIVSYIVVCAVLLMFIVA